MSEASVCTTDSPAMSGMASTSRDSSAALVASNARWCFSSHTVVMSSGTSLCVRFVRWNTRVEKSRTSLL